MKRVKILQLVLAFSIMFLNKGALSDVLIGSDAEYAQLVRIDTSTGATTVIGNLGDPTVAGLAYDKNHNILYGSSTATNQLLIIDPYTGQTKSVGPFGVGLMHGIEYDPINDILYGVTNVYRKALYKINVQTGSATLVSYLDPWGLSGLAFDSVNDVMYASDIFQKNLYTINLADGSTKLIGSFGTGRQIGVGLAHDTSFGLFASDNMASAARDDKLYRINPLIGQATQIGNTNTGNLLGLTFIPEPGTVLLLGLGGLFLRRKK